MLLESKQIKQYQFTSDILLKHQKYIMDSGYLGLVQYYTLQGSFFMNQYMRNMTKYTEKNIYLNLIIMLLSIIKNTFDNVKNSKIYNGTNIS